MKNLSEANNASFQILIIPDRVQVNDAEWNYAQRKLSPVKLQKDAVQKRLLVWCKNEEVNCIDLLPYFNSSNFTYYNSLRDMHFKSLGHRRTAEILVEKLTI